MKLDEIDTRQLLPNWAHGIDWIQVAFDAIVKACAGRIPVIDAPLTLQSIQAMTDAELREWFARYGIVEYYPDLQRTTRENMLFWLCRLYRRLGTPEAVRALCRYIFDEANTDVEINDNLAFDEGGALVDATLLDLFDIVVNVHTAQFRPDYKHRLLANILRIARNSQTLRNIYYEYETQIPLSVACVSDSTTFRYGGNDDVAPLPFPTVQTYSEGMYATVADGAGITTALQYSAGNLYSVQITANGATFYGPDFEIVNDNGFVRVVNRTGASQLVLLVALRYIDSTDSEIVRVEYISTGFICNAFKYSHFDLPWYFIPWFDEVWTDDLASIGYREAAAPALPTVSVTGDWGSGNWLYVGVSAEYVYANASRLLYKTPGGQQLLYDASKSYAPMTYTSSNGGSYKSPVEMFTISGNGGTPEKVVVNNITSSNIVLYSISVAVCSDSTATVVTVYNSSNVAYNAFKYTASGTDYYYVLDGTQTDWTDDLAGIGYSLTPNY